jgi:hypothetical protein
VKIIYIARCDYYNQVFLGDFVFLSSVLSRHKNSDNFTEEEETSSLSLSLFSFISPSKETRNASEIDREREERFVSISQNRKNRRIQRKEERMRCCVCYSDETELGDCEVIECASGHVTCAECFNEHVKVETAKGAG